MQVIVTVSYDQALPDVLGHLPAATGPVLLVFTLRHWCRSDVFATTCHKPGPRRGRLRRCGMFRTGGEPGEARGSAVKLLAPAGEPGVTARSRLSAEHVAVAVAAVCLVLFGVIHATTDVMVVSLFSIAPLVAATVAGERRTAVFASAAVALAIGAGWWDGATGGVTSTPRT